MWSGLVPGVQHFQQHAGGWGTQHALNVIEFVAMTLQSAPRVGRRLDYRYVRENSRHQHVVRADYSKLVHGPLARPRKAKTLKKTENAKANRWSGSSWSRPSLKCLVWQRWVKPRENWVGLPRADPNGASLSVPVFYWELEEKGGRGGGIPMDWSSNCQKTLDWMSMAVIYDIERLILSTSKYSLLQPPNSRCSQSLRSAVQIADVKDFFLTS